MSDTTVTVTIYTDGACQPNPGESGYAAVLIAQDESGREIARKVVHGYEAQSTNQRAEIGAAIIGLKALTKPSTVTVISDSRYVVNTMNGYYSTGSNLDLWQELKALAAQHKVNWCWVKGHNGHPGNELAHEESVRAMRLKGRVTA